MFERFTRPARDSVVAAQGQARQLGHGSIGPEHLLLAVLGGDGLAATALHEEGVDETTVRAGLRSREEAARRADAEALHAIGVDLDAVRAQAEAAFGPSALDRGARRRRGLLQRLAGSHLPFEPDARRALVLALQQATDLHQSWIGTEHLLLGLLALDGDPVGPLLGDGPGDPDDDRPVSTRVRERLLAALSPVG